MEEQKHRVRVEVMPRPIPGADPAKDGQPQVYQGYGVAGIYFPNGTTECEVTTKQLEQMRAAKQPKDAQGRPQHQPFMFVELGPVVPAAAVPQQQPAHQEKRK